MKRKTYRQNASMVSKKVGDTLVLIPIKQNVGDTKNVYTTSKVGLRIWEIIEEEHTLPEIISIISDEYEVKEARLEKDIVKFLDELESSGTVQISECHI